SAAAADYLALLLFALVEGGFNPGSDALTPEGAEEAASLARLGLEYIGARRDTTWVILKSIDIIRRELDSPEYIVRKYELRPHFPKRGRSSFPDLGRAAGFAQRMLQRKGLCRPQLPCRRSVRRTSPH
ncbi:MAG TPA: hypothetical protein VMT89_08675, partial [Candidatus Acidoferrales bacterium]|nr:hypothetical protein [Candidatus Acidoferrales bacterium]